MTAPARTAPPSGSRRTAGPPPATRPWGGVCAGTLTCASTIPAHAPRGCDYARGRAPTAQRRSRRPPRRLERAFIALILLALWSIVPPYLGPLVGLDLDVSAKLEVVDHVVPGVLAAVAACIALVLRAPRSDRQPSRARRPRGLRARGAVSVRDPPPARARRGRPAAADRLRRPALDAGPGAARAVARAPAAIAAAVSDGRVLFVGCGPGAPDLLTVRAVRALQDADVVIWSPSLLDREALAAHVREDAEIVAWPPANQGDIIAVYERALAEGLLVVRLKGGDPTLLARMEPELSAVLALGLSCELVPGVSAHAAGAAAVRLELALPEAPLLVADAGAIAAAPAGVRPGDLRPRPRSPRAAARAARSRAGRIDAVRGRDRRLAQRRDARLVPALRSRRDARGPGSRAHDGRARGAGARGLDG